ncbi:MAG TPA: MerR family transcriptional regulator [Chloroflexota bacterium]|nr:MerR family transcriptional regulator [Chloroflexota bacterium]
MYSIAELQQCTGATRRTIHYYVQEGILPSPDGAGPRAVYNEDHRARLLAVTHLKRRGWPLERIRDYFARVPADDIARLANGGQPLADSVLVHLRDGGIEIAEPPGEVVTHYRVAPGVELLIAASATEGVRLAAERTIALLREVFADKGLT